MVEFWRDPLHGCWNNLTHWILVEQMFYGDPTTTMSCILHICFEVADSQEPLGWKELAKHAF